MGNARARGTRAQRVQQAQERAWLADRTGGGRSAEPTPAAPLPILAPVRRTFAKVARADGNGHDAQLVVERGRPGLVADTRGRRYWHDGFSLRRVESDLSDEDLERAMRLMATKTGAA